MAYACRHATIASYTHKMIAYVPIIWAMNIAYAYNTVWATS